MHQRKVELPDLIRFGRDICGDLAQAERREWWLANGRGAYAAGTIAGTLTRRYHGLLVAPLDPPLGRYLVVAKADATVIDDGRQWPLHSNRWDGGVIDPAGYVHIESFRLEGRMPVWRFALGDARLEMRLWLEPGADTVYVAYRLEPGTLFVERTPELRVRLLVNARDHHGNTAPGDFTPWVESHDDNGRDSGRLRVRHAGRGGRGGFALNFQARGGRIEPDSTWYRNFDLPAERERDLPALDNHLCIGEAVLKLFPGEWVGVVAGLQEESSPYLEEAMRRFRAHEAGLLVSAGVRHAAFSDSPAWVQQLLLAADSFVFQRPLPDVPDGEAANGPSLARGPADVQDAQMPRRPGMAGSGLDPIGESVIAGYPWFGEWGRDTMIALPGLMLASGRHDSALRTLETFARYVDQGMLPNVFPGDGAQPEFNTVDAALWFIEAWRAFHELCPGDMALKRVFPVLAEIVDWHVRGTRYGIRVDAADGLLRAGEPGVQLTWMDAKVGDWVVTPRIGKPVEINALWYNALVTMTRFAEDLDVPAERYRALAEAARAGFQRFVHPQHGALYDVLDGPDGHDARVRPNQIFAVSLAHSPLAPDTQRRVVGQCAHELLTTYGLRSLAPAHPDFRPHYRGGVWERDGAYHQGPVWAWLLGHYALAEYRVTGDAAAAQQRLDPIRDHLFDAGLGTVSEIFDGAAPHTPRGAPAQAWSVACVLEAWWRLEQAKRAAHPPGEKPAMVVVGGKLKTDHKPKKKPRTNQERGVLR